MAKVLILLDRQPSLEAIRDVVSLEHAVVVRSLALATVDKQQLHRILQETVPEIVVLQLSKSTAGLIQRIKKWSDDASGKKPHEIAVDPPAFVVVRQRSDEDLEALQAAGQEGALPLDIPSSVHEILSVIDDALSNQPSGDPSPVFIPGLVGEGREMQKILRTILRFAASDAPVLLVGEPGVGKETIARTLHELRQQRRKADQTFLARTALGPFQQELRRTLITPQQNDPSLGTQQSQLSHHSGLYIADVDRLAPDLQIALADVLSGDGTPRIPAATTLRPDVQLYFGTTLQRLDSLVGSGLFLSDLCSKISCCRLSIPSLRRRRKDIPALTNHFLARSSNKPEISPEVLDRLMNYPWPRNIAQLQQALTHAAAECTGGMIQLGDLPPEITA